jgi:3-hydroxyisobutyrate dehydrogenase-like beta-hydroxyacid dehydrogenase
MERIGFVGLGRMGAPIAKNLVDAGFGLRVYNRTAERADPLVEAGAERASTPAEVASPGGVVVTMVADDAALEEIAFGEGGFGPALGDNGLHVSMSTVAPATLRTLKERHAAAGSRIVAAPVFGRPEAAEAAKLWVCVSGDREARERARPILDAIGQRTFDFGDDVGTAAGVKLGGNFLILAAMESIAEALMLAEREGASREATLEMLTETLFAAPVYKNYGRMIAAREFPGGGFSATLGLKDASLVTSTAASRGARMPVAEIVRERLRSLVDAGRGDDDWASFTLGVEE